MLVGIMFRERPVLSLTNVKDLDKATVSLYWRAMAPATNRIATPRPTSSFPQWLLPLAAALICAAVYANTLGFEFVYDDYGQIQETTRIQSWSQIPSYFTSSDWSGKATQAAGYSYYRPIFVLWLLVNNKLFGPDPAWWHFTTVLVHLAATVLVFFVARRLTGDEWAGAIAALIFGLHPTHLESVAWISGITDPLMTVFLLGSFLAYLETSFRWLIASIALFALAMFEKETAIVFPAILAAYELLFRHDRRTLRRLLPFAAAIAIYLSARYEVLHGFATVATPFSKRQLLLTLPSLLTFYAGHLVWPFGLSPAYTQPVVSRASFHNFGMPVLALALIAALLLTAARNSKLVAFCAVWLVFPILPVLDIRLFTRSEAVHDRYLYFICVPFAILVAYGIRGLRMRTAGQAAIAIVIAAVLAYGSVRQSHYWSSSLALFTRANQTAPDSEVVAQGMGTALLLNHLAAEAIPYFKRVTALRPDRPEGWYSVGRCYYELGMYREALPYLERGVHLNNSKSLLYYAFTQLKLGNLDRAEAAARAAIQGRPADDFREYHLALGEILKAKGDLAGARREMEAELRENPESPQATAELAGLK